jgi:MFS family permease
MSLPQGPLKQRYSASVALVILSLVPYLVLSVAVLLLAKKIGHDLGLSPSVMDITVALSTGAYSAGTVLAVQFAVHLPARRMLVLYETLFVISSVLAAAAPDGPVFIGAFLVQGLCTSLMLIAAVPPLVTAWPAKKMPTTGAIMNLCIFGAVAVGPTLGALQLDGGGWRTLFWAVAALAALALLTSLLTFSDEPGQDAEAPWDFVAIGLVLVGCTAAFYGAGRLQSDMAPTAAALGPLIGGFVLVVALVVFEHQIRRPLMPIKAAASTVPVTGLVIALTASASAFGLMVLLLQQLQKTAGPGQIALDFLPEFGGAVVTAAVFGLLFKSKYTPVLALFGLCAIIAAAGLLIATAPPAIVTAVLGIGVGASVSPALFLAGLSMESRLLPRVFAMIELMRGVTAFMLAPIFVFLAASIASTPKAGLVDTEWVCLTIAAIGLVAGAGLYVAGRPRLVTPDIDRWQGAPDQPAWDSPPLFAQMRLPPKGQRKVVAASQVARRPLLRRVGRG